MFNSPLFQKFPPRFQKIQQLFTYSTCIFPPYFDHDAFMHHPMHVPSTVTHYFYFVTVQHCICILLYCKNGREGLVFPVLGRVGHLSKQSRNTSGTHTSTYTAAILTHTNTHTCTYANTHTNTHTSTLCGSISME